MSTTPHTIEIANDSTTMHTDQQHGMRYPDGTHKWGEDKLGGHRVEFRYLALQYGSSVDTWDALLKSRAEQACLDFETYKSQHIPVTRTVVVAVTEAVVTK